MTSKLRVVGVPTRYRLTAIGGHQLLGTGYFDSFEAARDGLLKWATLGRHLGVPRTPIYVYRDGGITCIVCAVTLRGDADWDDTVATIEAMRESLAEECK